MRLKIFCKKESRKTKMREIREKVQKKERINTEGLK